MADGGHDRAAEFGARLAEVAPWFFGVVGSGPSFRLVEAYTAGGGAFVPFGGETAAGLAAAGAWAAAGKAAGALTIKGPGLANLLPAMAFADLERRPLLTVSEANADGSVPARRHKHLAHREAVSAFVRAWSALDAALADISGLVGAAVDGIPGPVHVDLAAGDGCDRRTPPAEPWVEVAGTKAMRGARRPAVVLGGQCSQTLAAAIAGVGVPVFTTASRRGAIDDSSPGAAGVFTAAGGPASAEASIVAEADRVVALGVSAAELLAEPPPSWLAVEHPQHEGDATELLELLIERAWGGELVADARARERVHLRSPGWWPGDVAEVLDEQPEPHVVVTDTGAFCTFVEHLLTARPGRRMDGSPNGRYMGTAIPVALGWALAGTDPVVCVVGDGGAPQHLLELRVAVDRRLPLCLIVVADGRYTSVLGGRRVDGAAAAAVTSATNWWSVAAALGADAVRVTDRDGLSGAVAKWCRTSPLVVECRFPAWDPAPLLEVRR